MARICFLFIDTLLQHVLGFEPEKKSNRWTYFESYEPHDDTQGEKYEGLD